MNDCPEQKANSSQFLTFMKNTSLECNLGGTLRSCESAVVLSLAGKVGDQGQAGDQGQGMSHCRRHHINSSSSCEDGTEGVFVNGEVWGTT